jgi:hypothetical protein
MTGMNQMLDHKADRREELMANPYPMHATGKSSFDEQAARPPDRSER